MANLVSPHGHAALSDRVPNNDPTQDSGATLASATATVATMWRELDEASFARGRPKEFSEEVVVPNDTRVRCVDNDAVLRIQTTQARLQLAKPIHAHLTTPTASSGSGATNYAAGQSPPDTTYADFLVQGLTAGTGVFQFVSPKALRHAEHSRETPIIDLLRRDLAKSGSNPLILGGRYACRSLTPMAGKEQADGATDFLRYALEVVDLHACTSPPTTITVPITQVGLKFNRRVLEPREIRRANTLLDEHHNARTHFDSARGSDAPAEQVILSRAGFGRNATLITYRKVSDLIQKGRVSEANLDATLRQQIDAERIRCGPRYVHSRAQLAELRMALSQKIASTAVKAANQSRQIGRPRNSTCSLPASSPLADPATCDSSSRLRVSRYPAQRSPPALHQVASQTPHLASDVKALPRSAPSMQGTAQSDDPLSRRNFVKNFKHSIGQVLRGTLPIAEARNSLPKMSKASAASASGSEMRQDLAALYSNRYRTSLADESEEWLFPLPGTLASHHRTRCAMDDFLRPSHDVQSISGEKQGCWLISSWLSVLLMSRPEDLKRRVLFISGANVAQEEVHAEARVLEAVAKKFHDNPIAFLQRIDTTARAEKLKWQDKFDRSASLGPRGPLDEQLRDYLPEEGNSGMRSSAHKKSIEKFLRHMHLQIAAAYRAEKEGDAFMHELAGMLNDQPGFTDLPVLLHRAMGLPVLVIESGSEAGGGSSLQLRVTAPKGSPLEQEVKRINAAFFDYYDVEKMMTDLFNEFKYFPVIRFTGCHFDLYLPKNFTTRSTMRTAHKRGEH